MDLNKLSMPTALVVCAGMGSVVAMAALKVSPEYIAGVAASFIAIAGALEKLVK